jgi:hypothetical protein
MTDISQMQARYFLPKEMSIDIHCTFQGKEIDKPFFDLHPEIHHLYPSASEVSNMRKALFGKWQKGDQFTINISENGVIINKH